MSTILTAEQEAIAERVAQIVIARMPEAQPLPEAVTVEVAMKMLSCDTIFSLYRELRYLGVKPYRRGKYRRQDIINAVARRSYAAKAAQKGAA